MTKLQWFKFFPSDWMMGKIMKCPEVTQARFVRLCCLYWNKQCDLSLEDAEVECDEEHIQILIKKKIISVDGEYIRIAFLDEQAEGIEEMREKRREAARKRWSKKDASAMQVHASASENNASAMQSDAEKNKKREEKKREEKNKIIQLCPFFFDEEFVVVWKDYEKVRKKKKASDSHTAIVRILSKLKRYSEGKKEVAIEIIAKSADSGWSDIYELDNKNRNEIGKHTKVGARTTTSHRQEFDD